MSEIIRTSVAENPMEIDPWYGHVPIRMTIGGQKVYVFSAVWLRGEPKAENLWDIRAWVKLPHIGDHKGKYIYTVIMKKDLTSKQVNRIVKQFSKTAHD